MEINIKKIQLMNPAQFILRHSPLPSLNQDRS